MKIIVDVRERELIDAFSRMQGNDPKLMTGLDIEQKQLPLGDILFPSASLIIERKTIDDLVASIRDGRYKEQSFRLQHNNGEYHHHNILYVVEGVLSKYPMPTKKVVYGAITSLNYGKGFSVIRTSSVTETAELLAHMAAKIEKDYTAPECRPHYLVSVAAAEAAAATTTTEDKDGEEDGDEPTAVAAGGGTQTSYSSVAVRKVKRDNLTRENIWEIMLMQIPFVSTALAAQLMETYKTLPGLVAALEANPACLDGIKLQSPSSSAAAGGKKPRKVASNVIESIKTFLLPAVSNPTTPSNS